MRELTETDFDHQISDIHPEQFFAARDAVRIVHHVPGRLRIRISPKKLQSSNQMQLDGIRNFIEGITGINGLRISKATLSAVIDYDPEKVSPHLWDHLFDDSNEASQLAFATLAKAARSEGGGDR